MQRLVLFIIGIAALLVIGSSLGARWLFPPLPLPADTPTPTVAVAIEVDDLPEFAPSLVDVRQVVQVPLGDEWRTWTLTTGEARRYLQQISEQTSGQNRRAATALGRAMSEQATLLAAARTVTAQNEQTASLLVMALQRNGVGLERYLQDVKADLTTQGVVVVETTISADFRADHLPVGVIRYRLPPSPATEAAAGLQLITLDQSGERLIIFTFHTSQQNHMNLLPIATDILRLTQF
jgi:hypothetical protein